MIDIEASLLSTPWWPMGVWIALYVTDYYLTLWGARLLAAGARDHFAVESYELTPQFQKDVNRLRTFSPRFFGYVVLSTAFLLFLWCLARLQPACRAFFLFAYGGLVFMELVILVRHAHNVALFRHLKEHQGVEGCVRYSHWLSLEVSSIDLTFMGLLLLAAAVVSGSDALYGGACFVLATALAHRRLSRKSRANAERKQDAQ